MRVALPALAKRMHQGTPRGAHVTLATLEAWPGKATGLLTSVLTCVM